MLKNGQLPWVVDTANSGLVSGDKAPKLGDAETEDLALGQLSESRTSGPRRAKAKCLRSHNFNFLPCFHRSH